MDSNLGYLICMLEYLDDSYFDALISFIFGKEKSKYYNPYATYKELFLNLILNNVDNINQKSLIYNLNITELMEQKRIFENNIQNKSYEDCKADNPYPIIWEIFTKMTNNYRFKHLDYNNSLSLKNTELEEILTYVKNNYFLPIDNYRYDNNPFLKYIDTILNSLMSFKVSKDVLLKKEFYKIIDDLIKRKRCYEYLKKNMFFKNVLYCHQLNPITEGNENIIGYAFQLIENDNKLKLNNYMTDEIYSENLKWCSTLEGHNRLLGIKKFSTYKNKLDILDQTIEILNKRKIESNSEKQKVILKKKYKKEHLCPMCMSEKNIQNRTLQRCKICKKLLNYLIMECKAQNRTPKRLGDLERIIERIPSKLSDIDMTNEEKREQHYKKLNEFLIKLYKGNKNNTQLNEIKNKNEIERLINLAFGDIEPFNFENLYSKYSDN